MAVFLAAILAACDSGRVPEDPKLPPATTLDLNEPIDRELSPGEADRYELTLSEGQFFEVLVDQRGVDVATTLRDPGGGRIFTVDRLIGYEGPERLLAVAEAPGPHQLEVRASPQADRPPGMYRIELQTLRAASPEDDSIAKATRQLWHGVSLTLDEEGMRQAVRELEQALDLFKEIDDDFWLAEALFELAMVLDSLGEHEEAFRRYNRSAELFSKSGNRRMQGEATSAAGTILFSIDRVSEAIEYHHRALKHQQAAGSRRGQAVAHNNLGQCYRLQGQMQKALDHYLDAKDLWDVARGWVWKAQTHHDLGVLYRILGKLEQASKHLWTANREWTKLGRDDFRAISFNELGRLHHERGDFDAALDSYSRALELRKKTGSRRGEATTLANIGLTHSALGQDAQARDQYRQSLEILRELENPGLRRQAKVSLALGSLEVSAKSPTVALGYFNDALVLYQEIGDPVGEAESYRGIALAQASLGDLAAARSAARDAFDLVEQVRISALSPSLRASFFATAQGFPELLIDLLMRSHREQPQAGYDVSALQTSEQARARSLLELLAESRAGFRHGVAPELLEEESELREKLNQDTSRLHQILSLDNYRPSWAETLQAELQTTSEALEKLQTRIREASPRYADLTQPRPLGLPQIQRMLPPGTLLLKYQLAEDRSFLWRVTPDSLMSFELAGRDSIDSLVREAYELLQGSRDEDAAWGQLCELSGLLLGPLTDHLTGDRLVIVADEALHFLPFAALPRPSAQGDCAGAPQLIDDHEIVYLPSASVLKALRDDSEERSPAPSRLAVIADPIFSLADERVRLPAGTERPRGWDSRFQRLPGTADEAKAILSFLNEPELGRNFLGLEANKQTVLDGGLKQYQIVHFATHGVLTAEFNLSGLALSGFDEHGKELDAGGLLSVHELYNLDLPAELVVLSACETALGQEIRGEGLVGLARGFMYAGAPRLVVSLWQVGDASTRVLMPEFYRELLRGGLSPAAALRQAQLAVRKDRPAPFYWAAFVLQGDWRPLTGLER